MYIYMLWNSLQNFVIGWDWFVIGLVLFLCKYDDSIQHLFPARMFLWSISLIYLSHPCSSDLS